MFCRWVKYEYFIIRHLLPCYKIQSHRKQLSACPFTYFDSSVCIAAQWDHSRCATETGPRGLGPTCAQGTITMLINRILEQLLKRFSY